jgi:hypothetical protein
VNDPRHLAGENEVGSLLPIAWLSHASDRGFAGLFFIAVDGDVYDVLRGAAKHQPDALPNGSFSASDADPPCPPVQTPAATVGRIPIGCSNFGPYLKRVLEATVRGAIGVDALEE